MMQTVETVSTAEPKYQPATTAERWLGVAVVGLWILHLATILLRPPGSYMLWADSGVYDAIYLGATLLCVGRARRHPAQRGPWLALALSLAVTIAGDQYYNLVLAQNPDAPYPSLADVFWLTFFPAAYVGLALLIRTTVPRFMSSMWLDGLIAGLGGAALIYTFAFDELLALTEGSRAAVLVSLAYPVGDLLLLVMLLGGVVMLGSRAGRMWTLLALGLVAFSVSDVLYAYGLAAGAYVEGSPVDLGWTAAAALMGLASLSSPTVEDDSVPVWWAQLIVPGALSFGTIGLLVYGQRGTVPLVATVLALGALGAGGVRVLLTWREVANLSETRRQARTDELTGLLNRRGFRAELSAALEERRSEEFVALLLLDLDRFKEVNDSVGHEVGDRLLELIGPRVDSCLRGSDVLARLGGDEFAVVLTDQGDPESVAVIAERVVQALSRPFDLPEISLHIGVSIGIAICPDHAADVAALLRQADVAMYDAKSNGGGYRFYNRARDRHSRDRLETIEQLRAAIAGGELVLHYQPKIDLRTGAVPGVEALVRWEHPDRGVLTPDHFLPLVEHAGLMRQLTDTVLDAALAQLRSWRELGWDLSVAVNISTSCLLNARLGSQVATALERHEIPANKLSLEITENALMSDPVRAGQMISSLHERGIVVSVDDFGTGFSSLAYLRDFDVRELKLDQGFIKDVCSDSRSSAIVRSTVDLAHSLGLNIVAEGIEDEHSARLLTGFGCDVAQGFYYCRPIPAKDLGEWLLGRPGTASASEVRLDGTADQTAS